MKTKARLNLLNYLICYKIKQKGLLYFVLLKNKYLVTSLKVTGFCTILASINLRQINICHNELKIINGKTTNIIETVNKLNINNIKSSYLKLIVGTGYKQICK